MLNRTESATAREIEDKELVEGLWKTIQQSGESKMDLRLLRSLDASVDLGRPEIGVEQLMKNSISNRIKESFRRKASE